MKLYPNQISAIEYIIERVTEDGRVLDAEIKGQMDLNKKWGAKDRRYFQQATYDIIRHYELLKFLSEKIHKSVVGTYLHYILDFAIDFENIEKEYPDLPFETRYSIPVDVLSLFRSQNAHAEENLKAMHGAGGIYLRINTSLFTMNEFENKLKEHEIEYHRINEIVYGEMKIELNCIQLFESTQKHKEIFKDYEAYYEIQDLGSQVLTALLDLKNANVIIESCAGHGGKTTHLLDKTRELNPLIISFDSEKKRIEHLQTRIAKWKNHKVVTEQAREKDIAKYGNMADLLYMDMPCTGSGTIKRQSDMKYRLSKSILESKVQMQREIFEQFNLTLKSGGKLVYTTCSLFKDENESQIEWILKQGYELDYMHALEPRSYKGDGFFIGVLTKK